MSNWKKSLCFGLLGIVSGYVLLCAFSWTFSARKVRIEGAEIVAPGALGIYSIAGSDYASWTISPKAPHYVDSDSKTFVFTSPNAGEFRIVAASVRKGRPVISEFYVTVGERKEKRSDNDNDSDKEPDEFRDWMIFWRNKLPADTVNRIDSVFNESVRKASEGEIETASGLVADVRFGVMMNEISADEFLDSLAERIQNCNPKTAADVADRLKLFFVETGKNVSDKKEGSPVKDDNDSEKNPRVGDAVKEEGTLPVGSGHTERRLFKRYWGN